MTDTKTDLSHVRFSSTVFPSNADMELWNSLTPEEQRAVVARDLDDAEKSGSVAPESAAAIIERVRNTSAT